MRTLIPMFKQRVELQPLKCILPGLNYPSRDMILVVRNSRHFFFDYDEKRETRRALQCGF